MTENKYMEKKVLVVVDMQNDFIDGALGTKEAEAIVDNVRRYIENFDGEVVFTRDTHFENYLETQEGKKLPVPHCIKGTKGYEIRDGLYEAAGGNSKIFDKITFGSTELSEYLKTKDEIDEVTLIGLCTDICVISNALMIKGFLPEVRVKVVENCMAGVTVESHKNAIEAMKMCQIEVE